MLQSVHRVAKSQTQLKRLGTHALWRFGCILDDLPLISQITFKKDTQEIRCNSQPQTLLSISISVQFSHSVVSDSLRPHESQHARRPCPSQTPRVYSIHAIESVMPSSHLILCRPLLLLPSIFPSIRVFSSESALHIRGPKYWSLSFSISPSNEYSGLISSRMD